MRLIGVGLAVILAVGPTLAALAPQVKWPETARMRRVVTSSMGRFASLRRGRDNALA
jgi:hypothetical protein